MRSFASIWSTAALVLALAMPSVVLAQSEGAADSVTESDGDASAAEDASQPAESAADDTGGSKADESPAEAEPNTAGEAESGVAQKSEAEKAEAKEQGPDPRPETFYVNRALSQADVIAEHQAKMEKAEWQQYRAKWAWTPKVRAETGLSVVPANADPDEVNNNFDEFAALDIGPVFEQKLSFLIPLYTFDRISIAQDLAAIGIDVEALKLEGAKRDVEFQVRRAYYAVQLSNALADLLAEGGDLIKEELQKMEDARDFGEADFEIEDLRKLQIFDAEVDSRRLDNKKLETLARAGIRYFAKVDDGFAVEGFDEEGEPAPLASLAQYQAAAKNTRPEVMLLDHAQEARRLQKELAKSEFYPNIFFAGTFRYVGSTETVGLQRVCRQTEPGGECVDTSDLIAPPYNNPLDVFSFGVALGMRWDFDYPQLYGKYRETVALNDEVEAQKARALGAIQLEIEKVWTDASHARQKVDITGRRLDAARRWRDQFGLGMQQGGGDVEDAVDPLKAYFEAKALNLQARFEYMVARAELAKAVGVPDLSMVSATPVKSE